MYLDKKYSREVIISLLNYNNIDELLIKLNTTEIEILNGWKEYIKGL